jgi:hypothetical protein
LPIYVSPNNFYTEMLAISLTAANTLSITNFLYSGTDTNGTLLSQFGGNATGATYLTNSFDSLAFGYRSTGAGSANTFDVSAINVFDNIQGVPEPGTLALLGGGAATVGLLWRRRQTRG